jgi:hypothetical protein
MMACSLPSLKLVATSSVFANGIAMCRALEPPHKPPKSVEINAIEQLPTGLQSLIKQNPSSNLLNQAKAANTLSP